MQKKEREEKKFKKNKLLLLVYFFRCKGLYLEEFKRTIQKKEGQINESQ